MELTQMSKDTVTEWSYLQGQMPQSLMEQSRRWKCGSSGHHPHTWMMDPHEEDLRRMFKERPEA